MIEHTVHGRTYTSRDEMAQRVAELDASYAGAMSPQAKAEWNSLNDAIEELDIRLDRVRELSTRSANTEAGASFHTPRSQASPDVPAHTREARDKGMRAIDRMELSAAAGDRLTDLVERDRSGHDGRYLEAVSDPAYEGAFAKRLMRPDSAQFEFTPQEAEAMRRVAEVQAEERAMSVGTTTAGGFAVPYALDPTIILTSDGSANPLRELATITTITTNEFRGVSSAGVTASFDAEASEVSDDSPTLAQPAIIPEMGRVFVPFSIELGMDWTGIQDELGKLIRDGKDQLEATKFTLGAGHGSTEPEGIIVGATTVQTTAGTAAFAIADVYSTQAALPPRYSPNAKWLSSNATANLIYRFVGGGSAEPPLFNESRDTLLGKPWYEASNIVSTTTTGSLNLVYGDIANGFRIVDRIGLNVELVPHLFHTSNNRPSGQRGLFAYWRTSSKVVNVNALRVTKIK
jgi:HK97 family phage major capsid protein